MRPRRSLASLFVLALTTTLMVLVGQAPAHAEEAETRVVIQMGTTKARFNKSVPILARAEANHPEAGWGTVPEGSLTLQRRAAGTNAWKTIQTHDGPQTTFYVKAKGNAHYQVLYSGGAYADWTFPAASKTTKMLRVARNLNDSIRQTRLVLRGKVAPRYARKNVVIQRKTCQKGCAWKRWGVAKTNGKSRWSKRLPAPTSGTWYWRAYTPKSTKFIKSFSDYSYETYRF